MGQFQNSIELIKQIQIDYNYFSGGERCATQRAISREDFKYLFDESLGLIEKVPSMIVESRQLDPIERMKILIDCIPPRALYLMWQAMAAEVNSRHDF